MSLIERLREPAVSEWPAPLLCAEAATQLEAMQAEIDRLRANLALTLDKLEGLVPFMRAMRRSDAGDIQEFVTKARASLDRQGK